MNFIHKNLSITRRQIFILLRGLYVLLKFFYVYIIAFFKKKITENIKEKIT